MQDHKSLIEAEEVWAAYNAYIRAQERILNKAPCASKKAKLDQCIRGLDNDRRELDKQWAMLNRTASIESHA